MRKSNKRKRRKRSQMRQSLLRFLRFLLFIAFCSLPLSIAGSCRELSNDRSDPFVVFFHNVMSTVLQPVNFGVGPVLNESLQALGPKAPVAHSPNQRDRQVSE